MRESYFERIQKLSEKLSDPDLAMEQRLRFYTSYKENENNC